MTEPRHCVASHPGTVRAVNQDAWLCRAEIGLFAVADGVGAHAEGETASRTIVEALHAIPASLPPAARLAAVRAALQDAHDRLLRLGGALVPASAVASTVVVLVVHEAHFACLWAGDARGYRLRDGVLLRLTMDHSMVQELVSSGVISEEQAATHPRRNVITRAVGAGGAGLAVDKVIGDTRPGDIFLLCSDGLYTTVTAAEIAKAMAGPGDAAKALVDAALRQLARDNVTAIVASF